MTQKEKRSKEFEIMHTGGILGRRKEILIRMIVIMQEKRFESFRPSISYICWKVDEKQSLKCQKKEKNTFCSKRMNVLQLKYDVK